MADVYIVQALYLDLAGDAAFEDGLIQMADLDADGSPEIVVVAASRLAGAAVVVLGVERLNGVPMLLERARSPSVGPGRWVNPVGMADFRGDGLQDVVAVVTPHVGGVLTLYRYEQTQLVPIARDVSNHVYGAMEQQLAAVTTRNGRRSASGLRRSQAQSMPSNRPLFWVGRFAQVSSG